MVTGISSVGNQMSLAHMGMPMPSKQKAFELIDSSRDGSISMSELQAMAERRPVAAQQCPSIEETFEVFDSDGNGLLSQEEAAAMHDEMRTRMEAPMRPGGSGIDGRPQGPGGERQGGASLLTTVALRSYTLPASVTVPSVIDLLS